MTTESSKLQTTADIPAGVAVPKVMETRLGLLTFHDGAPSNETVKKVYDNLDFTRALDSKPLSSKLPRFDRMIDDPQYMDPNFQEQFIDQNGNVLEI